MGKYGQGAELLPIARIRAGESEATGWRRRGRYPSVRRNAASLSKNHGIGYQMPRGRPQFVKLRGRYCSQIKEAHMSRALTARVMAAAAIAACLHSPAAQAQDVKFVLDFISLGRHAPWYVALGKGYFKDEGLNVTIMPSKGTADAIRTAVTRV